MSLTEVREIELGAAALFVICQCFYSYTSKKVWLLPWVFWQGVFKSKPKLSN